MLKLNNVHTCYGNIKALKGISIEIEQGEIVTLIGANGAGKTTTLMSISGIVPIRDGEVVFEGKSISRMAPNDIVALGICQVPEGRRIFPYLTVLENLDPVNSSKWRPNEMPFAGNTEMSATTGTFSTAAVTSS